MNPKPPGFVSKREIEIIYCDFEPQVRDISLSGRKSRKSLREREEGLRKRVFK
jgi:hypothetical protein